MRFARAVSCLALCTSTLVATAAHAQQAEKQRRLHLGLGVDAMDHLGDECVQDLDVTRCSAGALFASFAFSASFRVAPWVSLGARFAAASKNTDAGGTHAPRHLSIWQVSFEPRAYPLGYTRVAPFLGLALGYGSLRQTSAEVPEKTTGSSLLVGGAVGADFSLSDWIALSSELRVTRMDFVPSSGAERNDGRSTYYTGKAWLSIGLQLVALLPV